MTGTYPLAAVEVIEANLAAYNARDIDGFMRWFAEEVEVIDQKTGAVVMRGLVEVRRFYAVLFETSPALHSHVLQRVAVGGFVVDHERVTARAGGDMEILITYDVRDGRIQRVWFVREPLPDAVSLRARVERPASLRLKSWMAQREAKARRSGGHTLGNPRGCTGEPSGGSA